MTRIITHAYRPKRAPRKKAKAAALTVPRIVNGPTKGERARRREAEPPREVSPEEDATGHGLPPADDAAAMTPPADHARIACMTLAVILAASALAHGVTCLTPQCVLAGAIVQALAPQR
jgi:hypothetical protein